MGGCHQHSEQAAVQAIREASKATDPFSEMSIFTASLCTQNLGEIIEEERGGMSLSLPLRVQIQAPFHHLSNQRSVTSAQLPLCP